MVPSLDDVMPIHTCPAYTYKYVDVHVSPESVDVQMFPPSTVAASLVPSLDIVMPTHCFVLAVNLAVNILYQYAPESADPQMLFMQDAG